MKIEIKKKGVINLKHGDYEYPITYQLIKDGRKNKVLHKKINSKIIVTMIHGQKDEVVPVVFSKYVLKLFSKDIMDIKINKTAKTFWKERKISPGDMSKQF